MKGKIIKWKDKPSFGFIIPDGSGKEIFFHITSVQNRARRPEIGDVVSYDERRDAQGRLEAKDVVIEGVKSKPGTSRKGVVDYLAMLVMVLSLGLGVYVFYKTGSIGKSAPIGIGGLLLVVVVMIFNRQKKLKEKYFTCARCNKKESHSKRTIRAKNNALTKFYCDSCHRRR